MSRNKIGFSFVLLVFGSILAGCDNPESKDAAAERVSAAYRSAMDDYRAGRIQPAVAAFEKLVREDPANASARFQLACLLQDAKHDALAAYCAYNEYLVQHPHSDKAEIARVRMALCEREMSKKLAAKYGLDSSAGFADEVGKLRGELKVAQDRSQKSDSDLAAAMRRVAELRQENERLIEVLKSGGDGKVARPDSGVRDAKALLEEDEDERNDRVASSEDIAALRQEGADEMEVASAVLPTQSADDKEKRDAAEKASELARREREEAAKKAEPPHERRPESYVVQEGDTLIRIAIRFYGKPAKWKSLREYNKAVVSMDGRVKAGDVIRFPDPEK